MKRSKVYLAGPIAGLSHSECTEWREYAENYLLDNFNVKGVSPMRGKGYLAHLPAISKTGEEYVDLGVLSTASAIMARDYFDCTTCDVLLVNFLGAKEPSIGTISEMAWAYMKRTPIVIAIEPDGSNPNEHLFIRYEAGFRVETLDHALDVVGSILS